MIPRFKDKAIEELEELLENSADNEHAFQTFFERRSFALPLPHLIAHHLQFESVITKFPIDTSIETDFCYITRSSARTAIVMIEIERPAKRIFTGDSKNIKNHSDFTAAYAQVQSWKDYVRGGRKSVLDRLRPILKPEYVLRDPIEFHYVLLLGRRTEFESDPRKVDRYNGLSEGNFHFITYDTVLRILREHREFMIPNIMRLSGQRYTFKYLHSLPQTLFGSVSSGEFFLAPKHADTLSEYAFEMDAWKSGKMLSYNGMHATMPLGNNLFGQGYRNYMERPDYDWELAFEE